MFSFRKITFTTLLASILFTAQTANANPTVIAALTAPAMMQEVQGIGPEDQATTACMALAVYHEALNQGDRGQRAVAHVILNRIKSGRFAPDACGVVFQRGQFSFVRAGKRIVPLANEAWNGIVRLVRSVQAGESVDPTSGAMFFYNPKMARPKWRMASAVRIGAHIFVKG